MTAEAAEEVAVEKGEFEKGVNIARSGTVIFGKINCYLKTLEGEKDV